MMGKYIVTEPMNHDGTMYMPSPEPQEIDGSPNPLACFPVEDVEPKLTAKQLKALEAAKAKAEEEAKAKADAEANAGAQPTE